MTRTLVVALGALCLSACGDTADPPSPPPVPFLQHPFDDFTAEWIESEWDVESLHQSPEALLEGLVPAFRADFEDGLAGAAVYRAARPFGEREGDGPWPAPEEPTIRKEEGASGYLHFASPLGAVGFVLPVHRDTPYCFEWSRRHTLPTEAPVVAGSVEILELHEVPDLSAHPDEPLEAVRAAMPSLVSRHRLERDPVTEQWQRRSVVLRTTLYTQAVVILLFAGDPGDHPDGSPPAAASVDFDALRVQELPLRRYLPVQDRSLADDQRSTVGPLLTHENFLLQPTKIAGDLRRAALLPPASTLRVPFRADGDFRIDASFGVVDESRPGWGQEATEFAVVVVDEAGRARTAELRRSLAPGRANDDRGWQDLRLKGSAAEGPCRLFLEVRTRGVADTVAAFAEPVVVRPRAVPRERRNVVLISIDTLRSDHLGCYGYRCADGSSPSPRIDALAAESLRFSQSRSVAPYTLPSHASLMTGLEPRVHGVVHSARRLVPEVHPLLARAFAEAGYRTAAYTGGGFVSFEYGFHHGFERYSLVDPFLTQEDPLRDQFPFPDARELNDFLHARGDVDAVGGWIETHAEEPFFLFVHTFEVHNYHPPKDRLTECLKDGRAELLDLRERLHEVDQELARQGIPPPPELLALLRDLYDATIADADRKVGRILDTLRDQGLLDHTVVVLTSDHGEEFGEHGGLLHGRTLYEEVLQVPLLIRLPEGRGEVRDEVAVTVDVAPTLRALCGLPADPRSDGRNLLVDPAPPFALAEVEAKNLARRRALCIPGERKWIENPDPSFEESAFRSRLPPATELYQLATDPAEREPLTGEEGAELARNLAEVLQRLERRRIERIPDLELLDLDLSQAVRLQLGALGYTIEEH